MQNNFDVDKEKDPDLIEINFTDEDKNNNFCMEIFCKDEKSSMLLKGRLLAFYRMYKMDTGEQNFEISHNETDNSVKVIGNVHNALHILQERGLISNSLYNDILSNIEVNNFLERSKEVTFLEDEENVVMENKKNENSSSFNFFSTLKKENPKVEPKLTINEVENICTLKFPITGSIQIKSSIIENSDFIAELADYCMEKIKNMSLEKQAVKN